MRIALLSCVVCLVQPTGAVAFMNSIWVPDAKPPPEAIDGLLITHAPAPALPLAEYMNWYSPPSCRSPTPSGMSPEVPNFLIAFAPRRVDVQCCRTRRVGGMHTGGEEAAIGQAVERRLGESACRPVACPPLPFRRLNPRAARRCASSSTRALSLTVSGSWFSRQLMRLSAVVVGRRKRPFVDAVSQCPVLPCRPCHRSA